DAAAQGYFRKAASELTLGEAALLAGVPQAPGEYHPRLNCIREAGLDSPCVVDELGRMTVGNAAKLRQEDVLDLMVAHGRTTPALAEAAKREVLKVYPSVSDLKAAAWVDNQIEPMLVRMCEAGRLPLIDGSDNCLESVHSAGYKVTTTLNWEETQAAQSMAQAEVARGIESGCNCYNAAITTIDPSTGQLIVYVPNVDPTNTTDPRIKGDIDQAVEINQPGSSFKPAVYLTWFDVLGKAPMDTFWDTSPLVIQGTRITNPRAGQGGEGLISARAGLGGSQNVPSIRAAAEAGVDNVIVTAQRLGITTLAQGFDPTFVAHADVTYGASIATGGANIRNVDMAYMNATISNMGVMVGVPHLARYVEISDMKGTFTHAGAEYDTALQQHLDFQRGNIRVPGTRALDPVVVLRVESPDGRILYDHETAGDLVRQEVVNPGSVWLLHSIMSDCTARFIIWGCGGSNTDLRLDIFVTSTGEKIPAGVKTGTQQGFTSAADTLEVWTNGYSRYAATAVWVGNSNNELVRDGPSVGFAAAHTVLWLYKGWQGQLHSDLLAAGAFTTPAGFNDVRPGNVRQVSDYKSPSTDRTISGEHTYCEQTVSTWARTDVEPEDPCEEAEIDTRNGLLAGADTPAQFRETREFVRLPELGLDEAIELADEMGIPIIPTETSTGQ
ncbi:MAG: transglycosylase domain-containing protein, partial [Dehalococcoidia bacterium]